MYRQQICTMVSGLAEKLLGLKMQADWNQCTTARCGHRNGYYSRQFSIPHGQLSIRAPRFRQGNFDATVVFERYQRLIRDVGRILRHAYLLGASTCSLAQLAEYIFGGHLSYQTISPLMRWLDEQLVLWRNQPIEPIYPVVYIDGMQVDMVGSDRTVMLVVGGREGGGLDVPGFCASRGKRCTKLLEELHRRGLEDVKLFVSDEAVAIGSALERVYPLVSWQHYTFHRPSKLRATIGATDYRDAMLSEAACIFRCASLGGRWMWPVSGGNAGVGSVPKRWSSFCMNCVIASDFTNYRNVGGNGFVPIILWIG